MKPLSERDENIDIISSIVVSNRFGRNEATL